MAVSGDSTRVVYGTIVGTGLLTVFTASAETIVSTIILSNVLTTQIEVDLFLDDTTTVGSIVTNLVIPAGQSYAVDKALFMANLDQLQVQSDTAVSCQVTLGYIT